MVVISCPIPGCTYVTDDVSESLVGKLLDLHIIHHNQRSSKKGPKLSRPSVDVGVNEEAWQAFERRWTTFKNNSNICEDEAAAQLFECASVELSDLVLKMDQDVTSRPVQEVLDILKSLAVIPVAKGVIRAELMKLEQKDGEHFRTFAARVKGKAQTCGYETEAHCSCGKVFVVSYTKEAIRDVLLAGIGDLDIRREALSAEGVLKKPVNDIVAFVERREMSRKEAASGGTLAAMSTFKRHKAPAGDILTSSDPRKEARNCPKCKKSYRPYRRGKNGWNKKPYLECFECFQNGKTAKSCAIVRGDYAESSCSDRFQTEVSPILLNTLIFENSSLLRNAMVSGHPKVKFKLLHRNTGRKVSVSGVADTGAQSNLWGLEDFKRMGFTERDLRSVCLRISAANKLPLKINGAFNASLEGEKPNNDIRCDTVVYVSSSVSGFYLSFDTMRSLQIVGEEFPVIGGCPNKGHSPTDTRHVRGGSHTAAISCRNKSINVKTCTCPKRSPVPPRPDKLPFRPIPENIEKMNSWLLKTFEGSTFNTCPHQPLQEMDGPPLEIHVDPSAKPRSRNKPAPVPLHWQTDVYEELLQDKTLDVIERVPYGEPSPWCHPMVITRKHDGRPRRTVDLSPLNRYCKRETFPSETPFHLARRVPKGSWKTVCDAWNGYHSVPLRECDRHLTTFITHSGRWRYKRAPQGFLSSGDGYNRRFDAILADFNRLERCVDDVIHYDSNLEEHWWRTIDIIIKIGSSGVVLNPKKFNSALRL